MRGLHGGRTSARLFLFVSEHNTAASSTHFTTNTSLLNLPKAARPDGFEMEQFFMPEWLIVRLKQLTIEQVTGMQTKAWNGLMRDGKDWVKIERVYGGPAVVEAYKAIASKGTDPTSGMIWSLWDGPELGHKVENKSKL